MKYIYTLVFSVKLICAVAQTKSDSVQKQIVSSKDIIKISFDNTAFNKKGLVSVNSSQINKYKNREVIIATVISKAKIKKTDIVLNAGKNSLKPDFRIVIKAKDILNFDNAESHYPGKKVEVTGKVVEYDGNPAIFISQENQIRVIGRK